MGTKEAHGLHGWNKFGQFSIRRTYIVYHSTHCQFVIGQPRHSDILKKYTRVIFKLFYLQFRFSVNAINVDTSVHGFPMSDPYLIPLSLNVISQVPFLLPRSDSTTDVLRIMKAHCRHHANGAWILKSVLDWNLCWERTDRPISLFSGTNGILCPSCPNLTRYQSNHDMCSY